MLTDDARLKLSPDVTFQSLGKGQETAILSLKSGYLYTCNDTTARFLGAVDGKRTLQQITDVLLGEYDVPREKLLADLKGLAARLVDEKLVLEAGGA